jgi:hypothetical protein
MPITQAHGICSDDVKYADVGCFQIVGEQISERWDEVKPFVDKWISIGYGEFATEDIYRLIHSGIFQLFCIHRNDEIVLIVITEFVQYPRMKVLRIMAISGRKPLLAFKFQPALECWARANGAEALETFATPKTIKLDERIGMKAVCTLMRMSLQPLN